MKIKMVALSEIKPYADNPRQNDAGVDAVAESIRAFGFRQPIVVDENGVIIVGHTRYKAAQKLGLDKVPVHVATGLTPEQVRAYRIADNQTATLSTWDDDKLTKELLALQQEGFDLDLTGFSGDDLLRLLNSEPVTGLTDPDDVPAPPDEATTQPGDLWILGEHRLLCGDSSRTEDVDRLLAGVPVHLVNTDPPYNVRVEPRSNNAIAAGLSSFPANKKTAVNAADSRKLHHQGFDLARDKSKAKPTTKKLRAKDRPLANDFVSDEAFEEMLNAWFGNFSRVLVPGRGFYIWGGYANVANYPPALKANGLYFSQTIIWDKQHPVLTRKDFMGAHEWCQPADTRVLTPDGEVPISSLREGDRVVSYSRNHHAMVGLREGLPVTPTCRDYDGDLYSVRSCDRMSHATSGHLWSIKLAPEAATYWCVYLMRRGDWWRVGKSKLLSTYGFGVKHRLVTEGGDAVWLLSVHPSNLEATIAEQIVLAEYGVPTTTWAETHTSRRTLADVAMLYDRLDLAVLQRNALRLLSDHGRCIEYPFIRTGGTRPKFSRRVSAMARTCNLFPKIMSVPMPGRGQKVNWMPVEAVERSRFRGPVYSMDVDGYGHYVADGLVTHNCFYGWKEGAAHQFHGPNNATDLWAIKKINPQSMVHLTEKPVELASRAIAYSSKAGEHILDLFGGSGSTLIAAEQLHRKAFLMEIDGLYCDVIVERFEKFTGKKAERKAA